MCADKRRTGAEPQPKSNLEYRMLQSGNSLRASRNNYNSHRHNSNNVGVPKLNFYSKRDSDHKEGVILLSKSNPNENGYELIECKTLANNILEDDVYSKFPEKSMPTGREWQTITESEKEVEPLIEDIKNNLKSEENLNGMLLASENQNNYDPTDLNIVNAASKSAIFDEPDYVETSQLV